MYIDKKNIKQKKKLILCHFVRATADCAWLSTNGQMKQSLAGDPKKKKWGSLLEKGVYK